MRNTKRLMAAFMTAAMILTSAPISSVPVFAATAGDTIVNEANIVATITMNAGKTNEVTYEYATLKSAFEKAAAKDEIVLKQNVSEEANDLTATKAITLNMNGFDIQAKSIKADAESLTIKGVGNITATLTGKIAIDGDPNETPVVKGDISGVTGDNLKAGVYVETAGTTTLTQLKSVVADGSAILKTVDAKNNTIYKVGTSKTEWTWTDGEVKPSADFDLVLDKTGESLLKSSKVESSTIKQALESPSCIDRGYKYWTGTATVAFKDDSGIVYKNTANKGFDAANYTFNAETKDEYKRIAGSEFGEVTGHDYTISAELVLKNNKAVTVDGALQYKATLTCKNCTEADRLEGHELDVVGTISKTVGETTTYENDGVTYKTKTTKVVTDPSATCKTEAKYNEYTFDILDADGKTLYKDAKLKHYTTLGYGDHNFDLTADNVKTYWIYEKNGVEIRVDVDNPDSQASKELIAYAKANGNKLQYKSYVTCKTDGCTAEKVLEDKCGTVTADTTKTAPTVEYKSDKGYIVKDGEYTLSVKVVYSYNDENKGAGQQTIEGKLTDKVVPFSDVSVDATTGEKTTYSVTEGETTTREYVFKSGIFKFDNNKITPIRTSTCNTIGLKKGQLDNPTKAVYYNSADTTPLIAENASGVWVYEEIAKDESKHKWSLLQGVYTIGGDTEGTYIGTENREVKKGYVNAVNATASADGQDGFTVYVCEEDGATPHYAISFSGKPAGDPTAKGVTLKLNGEDKVFDIYGENGKSSNDNKALKFQYTVVTSTTEPVKPSYDKTGDYLEVEYKVQYKDENDNGKLKDATVSNITARYFAGPEVEATAYETYGYSLVKANEYDLRCNQNVTYTAISEKYGNYEYTALDDSKNPIPGKIHGAYAGAVRWTSEGGAAVTLKCVDCGKISNDNDLEVVKKETVKDTCLTDGYTIYDAKYAGSLKDVTLTNATDIKSSIVSAKGHTIDPKRILATENEDGTYSATAFCTVDNEYVDVVTKVEGPRVQADKTRAIDVTYKNGLEPSAVNYISDKDADAKNKVTVTLIDKGSIVLGKENTSYEIVADDNKIAYGATDADVQKIIADVILENGETNKTTYSTVIKDADGKVIPAPRGDAKELPVGKYTAEATGNGAFSGVVSKEFEIVDNAVINSKIYMLVDGKVYVKATESSVAPINNKGVGASVSNNTFTKPVDVDYDRSTHTVALKAYSEYTDYQKTEDTSVTFKYYIDGKEVAPDEVTFTDAGKYDLKVVASKDNFQDMNVEIPVTIDHAYVKVEIDNSTMVEGREPDVKYTISSDDVKDVTAEELGLKITSSGGDDLTKLRPGTYTLTATITNENYKIYSDAKEDPKLTVVANDGSTTEEQALADAAAKKINDLTDASTAEDVAAARAAYDALSAKAKARVDAATVKKLTDAEDKVAADKVVAQLNKATTDADKAAAYEAYSKLSDAQKKFVDAKAPDAVAAAKTAKAAADAAKEAEAKKTATTAANTAKTAAAKVAKTNPKYTAVQNALKALNTALNNSASTSAQIKAATDKLNAAVKASKTAGVKKGATYTVGGQKYKATSTKAVTLTKAKNAKSVTVPATVKINGKKIAVTKIGAKAFAKSKATKVTIKTKKLTKKGVKKSLKGSKVKTIKVSCGKAYVKKYKKFFTKANAGKKVTVK